jgi:polyhydroxyalkanoate synthesis regulator protein
MQAFAHNQENMREYMRGAFEPLNPFISLEEMGKQQIALFERTLRMLTPFYVEEGQDEDRVPERSLPSSSTEAQIDELRARLNDIQKQLEHLVGKRGQA